MPGSRRKRSLRRRSPLILIIVGCLLLSAMAALFLVSPGRPSPITDDRGAPLPSAVAVNERPSIGGVPQGLIIRGEDTANPVLLYVHGGPGTPSFPAVGTDLQRLEKIFTICYWEQPGAGMSWSKRIPPATMNLDRFVGDAAEVTRYLMNRFHKKKIFILGHSWGTLLASCTIHKYPQYYYAYIGIGQIANTWLSEQESYRFVVDEAARREDRAAQEELVRLRVPARNASSQKWYDYYMIQRSYVFKYGGARYGRALSYTGARKEVLFCREYTVSDKIGYSAGVRFSQLQLDSMMVNTDMTLALPDQSIPVFIFQGAHDHQTSYPLAKAYFERLQAPLKRFYTFEHSAHAPHIEEYERFEKIIREEVLGLQ